MAAALSSGISSQIQCTGYILSDPTPPAFEIEPAAVEYDQAFNRGANWWTWTVRGFVASNSDMESQRLLDVWLAASGTGSVKAAIETDLTLGGKVDSLQVTSVSGPKLFEARAMPNAAYFGAAALPSAPGRRPRAGA